jgi:hypothetical protein
MLMGVSSIDYGIATKNTMTVKPIFNRLLAVVLAAAVAYSTPARS